MRGNVAKAWAGFKDKKEGDDGVANARSQNAFKFAEQAPSLDRRGRVGVDARLRRRGPGRARGTQLASRSTPSNRSS